MPFFANAHNTNAANSTFNDIAGDQINIFGISDQFLETPSTSIASVLQPTFALINYLKDGHDASKDRTNFLIEVAAFYSLLSVLERRAAKSKSGDLWFSEVQKLSVKDGPLDQYRSALKRLDSKVTAMDRPERVGNRLDWEFDKQEISGIFERLERLEILISTALAEDHFALSCAIKADVSEVMGRVVDIQMNQKNQMYHAIVDWLSPLDFKMKQNEVFQKREDGTGQWLLQSLHFKEWCDGTSETLWCRGIPGAGKTVLTSIVINHLQRVFEHDNVAVVWIYCNYKEQAVQTVPNLVASLLKQLVQRHSAISSKVESFYTNHKDRSVRPTLIDFMNALRSEIGMYSKVFVVVDALDECPQGDGTRARFLTQLQSLPSEVNLMVASRDPSSIERNGPATRCLEIRAHNDDVQRYIIGRIPREYRLATHVKGHAILQGEIVDRIIQNMGGMFLLAQLHMDSLANKVSRRAVREALTRLSTGVDEIYDETMKRIEEQSEDDRTLAKAVFAWITYAHRPLTLNELQHAVAVVPDMKNMDPDAIVDEQILISVCAGLVVVEEESSTIRLIHYTTQEYFESKRETLLPNAQANIAATCLTYLSFDVFGKHNHDDPKWLESVLEDYALLKYAVRYWGYHARGKAEETNMGLVLTFLQNHSKLACASQIVRRNRSSQDPSDYYSGLHILSYFGMLETIHHQIENHAEADLMDDKFRTPLLVAAANGHEEVVRLLVARDDVDVNSSAILCETPLLAAVLQGHEAVVKLLLGHARIKVELGDSEGQTALSLAAARGHETVVRLLVARDDVDVNSKDQFDQTPLSNAAEHGHWMVVKLLLAQENISANTQNWSGETPLSLAARHGHEAVVELLVSRDDVDVNLKDAKGETPLLAAAIWGRAAVVNLLVARDDIKVNTKDRDGKTPLWLAAKWGHEAVVKLLVSRYDVDVNSADHYGQTALAVAAAGFEAVVKLLLSRYDINVNSRDCHSQTALIIAAVGGHEAVVKLLLEHAKTDVNWRDCDNQTALSHAAAKGHEKVVMLLLAQSDIDVNSGDRYDRTPLSNAAEKGHLMVVKLLLAQDNVDVNLQDYVGGTPLLLAARNGHEAVVNLLLARNGINVNQRDEDGQAALSFAAQCGHEAVVKLLLSRHDIDVNSEDNYGKTPLSKASRNGHETVIKLLLARNDIKHNANENDQILL